jgi:hypothetical protein
MNRESDLHLPSGVKARIPLLAQTATAEAVPYLKPFYETVCELLFGNPRLRRIVRETQTKGRQLCPECFPTQESG